MRIVRTAAVLCLFFAILAIGFSPAAFAQNAQQTALRGIVTDPSGARVPNAKIELHSPAGDQTQTADSNGQYSFATLAPGKYDIEVTAPSFKTDQRQDFTVNGSTTLNIQLALEGQAQVVTVQESVEGGAVSTDPDANASATVLGKTELEALSDDPDELARQLQALAGPGVGPQGGQIYTDGFSGGGVPAKSAIREIRINSNPYSAEYDSPGNNASRLSPSPVATSCTASSPRNSIMNC